MEIDYQRWGKNVPCLCLYVHSGLIGIAPEDLVKKDGCELWTLEEAEEIVKKLDDGWRLPNDEEIKEISKQIDTLKKGESYWVGSGPYIFRTDDNVFVTDDIKPLVGCRIRCVRDVSTFLD